MVYVGGLSMGDVSTTPLAAKFVDTIDNAVYNSAIFFKQSPKQNLSSLIDRDV